MTATQLLPTMVLEIADDCDCCAACKATRLLSQQATIITVLVFFPLLSLGIQLSAYWHVHRQIYS